MISHMLHKMKTMGVGKLVWVLEPLESHIEVDKEGWHNTMRIRFRLVLSPCVFGTQYSDSSNDANVFPPYTMSYAQPSSNPSASIDKEYGMINYPHAEQIPFHLPYQMQQGFQTSMWVNPKFPIHGVVVGRSQNIYTWHVRSYNQYYRNTMSWYEYCLQQDVIPSSNFVMDPHRSSLWF